MTTGSGIGYLLRDQPWSRLAGALRQRVFFLLLALDTLFIGLHMARSLGRNLDSRFAAFDNDGFAIDLDGSYSELYQQAKIALIAVLLTRVAFKTEARVYLGLAAVFACVAIDDALGLHEQTGLWLSGLTGAVGAGAGTLAELFLLGIVGTALLALLAAAAIASSPEHRRYAFLFAVPLAAFVFFGGVMDLVHAIGSEWFPGANLILTIIEDGGEMLAMTAAFALAWSFVRQSPKAPAISKDPAKRRVFGIDLSALSRPELVRLLTAQLPRDERPRCVITANLAHVVSLSGNPVFRAAYDAAWSVTADGMPVYAYARLRGSPVRARVTGSDLFSDLMPALIPNRHRCFFVASCETTAERLKAWLLARDFPEDAVVAVVPPFGFETDSLYSSRLARMTRDHAPTHLMMGVGAPKSEIWVHRHREKIGACYVLCVGAGLDFFAGTKRRAPGWMQHSGCEWMWRLGQEPRRLSRRYFFDSWRFLAAVLEDLSLRADAPLGNRDRGAHR